MSDNGTARARQYPPQAPAQVPAQTSARGPATVTAIPHPAAVLLVDARSGVVTAASPAGRRRLTGSSGLQLSRWLAALATSRDEAEDDVTTLCVWRGVDGASATPVTLWARCTIVHRSHRALLVVLREDGAAAAEAAGGAADLAHAVFTLDAVGRVDSWGPTAQRLTGFTAETVVGNDATLLHPAPARLAGEPHRALTDAYRYGEDRSEGWRHCSDGRVMWAEVVTCALYDGLERLVGFATSMHDLTARRRLTPSAAGRLPAPRSPIAGVPARARAVPTGRPPHGGRPGLVPGQRRPSNG